MTNDFSTLSFCLLVFDLEAISLLRLLKNFGGSRLSLFALSFAFSLSIMVSVRDPPISFHLEPPFGYSTFQEAVSGCI
jgi:hypothetical protein